MKVFQDLISGDEFFSDSFRHEFIHNDACIEAPAKYVTKGKETVLIATDEEEEDDGEGETVIDIVDKFGLNEIEGWTKKDFMGWAKGYMPKVKAKLTEQGKQDRIPEFQAGATELVKFIISKFDEFQIFCGEKMDYEGALCFAYQKDQADPGPTFLFFKDGFKECKY